MNSWEFYPTLTAAVKADHMNHECGHHPFEHAVMVAQYALIIAPNAGTGKLAAVAGLIHNTDRLYPSLSPMEIEGKLDEYLDHADFNREECLKITTAVLEHARQNVDDDEIVTICLKDADRLANISPFDVIARAARAYPNLPLVNPEFVKTMDPQSTYRNPKTVFRDGIQSSLEWEFWLRLPKAIDLAEPYFNGLRMVQNLTMRQIGETGLLNL